jgi:hypothetical protein
MTRHTHVPGQWRRDVCGICYRMADDSIHLTRAQHLARVALAGAAWLACMGCLCLLAWCSIQAVMP